MALQSHLAETRRGNAAFVGIVKGCYPQSEWQVRPLSSFRRGGIDAKILGFLGQIFLPGKGVPFGLF